MREKSRDKVQLLHIVEALNNIFEFVESKNFEEFSLNKMLKFAVIKNLEIVGEAAYFLTKEFRAKHSSIDWDVFIGMRHVLAHDYYQIKDSIVWETIIANLPQLLKQINKIPEK